MARLHRFETSTWLPLPRDEVFAFFAEARNLERITPPELRFQITQAPEAITRGAIIDYRLSLAGVPFPWKTEIAVWKPGERFVDRQLRGPYRVWHHTHSFADAPGPDGTPGTAIHDEVLYSLPLAPFGELAAPLIHWQVRRIFAFREQAIRAALLGEAGVDAA